MLVLSDKLTIHNLEFATKLHFSKNAQVSKNNVFFKNHQINALHQNFNVWKLVLFHPLKQRMAMNVTKKCDLSIFEISIFEKLQVLLRWNVCFKINCKSPKKIGLFVGLELFYAIESFVARFVNLVITQLANIRS